MASGIALMLDYALPFLAVIGMLVLVHEAGHFLAARALGIRVAGFSLGMGPELAGWTDRSECRWSLRLLPIGGYVKFWGDENAASANSGTDDGSALTAEERAVCYQFRPPAHRALVLLGGPVANFALGLVVLVALYCAYGRQHTPPVLSAVVAGGPAAAAGLREGDLVKAIGGAAVRRFEDLQAAVAQYPDQPLRIRVLHAGGDEETLTVTPKAVRIISAYGTQMRIGRIGVQASGSVVERVSPIAAVSYASQDVWFFMRATATSVGEIIMGWRSFDDLGGPVKIGQVAGGAIKLGLDNLVFIIAVLSINLGVINLMPFPVLDGGHLVVCAYEGLSRRKASPAVLNVVFRGGAAAMLVLLFVISWNDVSSLYHQQASPQQVEAQHPSK
jgi:regulator of sigma E protease